MLIAFLEKVHFIVNIESAIEDLICSNNPLGFCLRQFVKPQHLWQHFGNTWTEPVHSIISPWVVDFLISLFCTIFRENGLFPASVFRSTAETPWQQVRGMSQPSMFCIFEVLLVFPGPIRPASISGQYYAIVPSISYKQNINKEGLFLIRHV